jgi:carboxymethylenebutenolidase
MPDARIEIEAEDGCLDAFVACPDGPGRRPPIVLLADRTGLTPAVETLARRIRAHDYFVLAPDWSRRRAEDRREDVDAWLDHLAGERRVDDVRIGVAGWGAGADLALRLAAWRSERVAAVAAYGGRGFGPATAREIAQRINAVVRLGYLVGRPTSRVGFLVSAFCESGVDFDIEVASGPPDWAGLADLFAGTLAASAPERPVMVKLGTPPLNP